MILAYFAHIFDFLKTLNRLVESDFSNTYLFKALQVGFYEFTMVTCHLITN